MELSNPQIASRVEALSKPGLGLLLGRIAMATLVLVVVAGASGYGLTWRDGPQRLNLLFQPGVLSVIYSPFVLVGGLISWSILPRITKRSPSTRNPQTR